MNKRELLERTTTARQYLLFAILVILLTLAHAAQAEEPATSPTHNGVNPSRPFVTITATGHILWNGREVKTDEQFRVAIITLLKGMQCVTRHELHEVQP